MCHSTFTPIYLDKSTNALSLVPERDDGVHLRGSCSGIETENNTDPHADYEKAYIIIFYP